MKKIPEKTNKIIDEFIEGVKKILGDRVKKLYFMDLMLEEISIKVLT